MAAAAPNASGEKFDILVAEDSLTQAFALKRLLEENGFGVQIVSNGKEGISALESKPFHLIITDIEMPVMDGYEMCSMIKARADWQHIPIILLTTLSNPENIVLGLKAQADYYLTKPYSPKFLLLHVQSLLKKSAVEEADSGGALEVVVEGKTHHVSATRRQMLNLLLSTYDNAVQQNRELARTQFELHERNKQLREQSRKLEVSETNFRTLLERNVDGMVVIDEQRSVLFVNPSARGLLHQAESELLGRTFEFEVVAGETKEVQIQREGRDLVIAELRAVDTVWEGNRACLLAMRDITERKQAEEKIREQQEKLREANLQLQALATTDGLTGLKNHRTFKERLEEEFQRSYRYNLPLSILMLDVDRFKQFNDTFGHPAGDSVLRVVARLLIENTRNTDFVARYGGEEFVLLLPNTPNHDAAVIGERLRLAIEKAPWKERAITASIGLASLEATSESGAGVVAKADQALYRAKSEGRNRVCNAMSLYG